MKTNQCSDRQSLENPHALLVLALRCFACVLVAITLATSAGAQDDDTNSSAQELPTAEKVNGDDSLAEEAKRDLIPELVDGGFRMPPLMAPSIATGDVGNGRIPKGFRGDQDRPLQPLPEQGSQRAQPWNWTVALWAAPNTYSYPRYFEDRMLERHGHERFGHLQPIASGARFFATMPMLPYLMTLQPPCQCEYTLGYHRSGSCAPMTFQRPPWNRRALIAESAAVAAAILIIP